MSQVFYRWGAGRDESRAKFDGTHISVFDFKRQVMLDNNLGNGKDFDLVVLENGEELKDDNHQIARSSSLVVRRRPASMKGRGTAQNYIIGTDAATSLTGDHRIEAHAREAMKEKMFGRQRGAGGYGAMSKRFDGKEDPKAPQVKVTTGDAEEDAKIQAMLQQQSETWEDMAADMSTHARFQTRPDRRPFKGPGGPGGANKFDFSVAPDKEPPVGYICFRCAQKGHWIQNCPTNDDPTAQDRKRFVRVTGIPRSMLKTVETPLTGEGSSQGAMLTADGGFVRAVPDQRQWQKQAAVKTLNLGAGDDDEALDPELSCHICKKLVREAVRVPCCDTSFCEECIESYLLEHDFECPSCESKIASLDKLQPAEDLRSRAEAYLEERKKSKEAAEEEAKAEKSDGGATPAAPDLSDVSGKNPYTGKLPDMNTLHEYQQAMMQTLRNPLVPPTIKAEIRKHLKMTNTNLLQMQMLAAQGLMFGAQMGNAMMGQQMGMMGMGGMPGMGMPMGNMGNMGMGNNNMNMGNMNMGGNGMNGMNGNGFNGMNGNGFNGTNGMGAGNGVQPRPGGRGGFRGGFRGRGFARGGAARVLSGARGADDPPPEKMQRVA